MLSLLKLLKPELRPYHDSEDAIFKLVEWVSLSIEPDVADLREMADILEDAAADPTHQPAIYAAFVREIARKTREARGSRAATPAHTAIAAALNGTGTMDPSAANSAVYDPQLMGQTASWQPGDTATAEGTQFQFIPQGGDMM